MKLRLPLGRNYELNEYEIYRRRVSLGLITSVGGTLINIPQSIWFAQSNLERTVYAAAGAISIACGSYFFVKDMKWCFSHNQ